MNFDKEINILEDCFDLLATVDLVSSRNEQTKLLNSLIDTLSNFLEPTQAPKQLIGAYLFASTAINSLKLALLKYSTYQKAMSITYSCVEASYSLLVD